MRCLLGYSRLTEDLNTYSFNLQNDYQRSLAGMNILFAKGVANANGDYNRVFFCESWVSQDNCWEVVDEKPEGQGSCYLKYNCW